VGEDPSALRHDVEEARAHLGDTVDALAYKASAPRRAADRAARQLHGRVTPVTAAVAAGCLLIAGFLLRRRGRG
jgi:phage tail protein X